MRRLPIFAALVMTLLVAFAPAPRAQQNDALTARALVGVWVWQNELNGAIVNNRLTLTGNGTFVYTSAMQSYQVTSSGGWLYQGGYLMFQTTNSSSLDPTGRPIGLGPLQILDVGPNYVRTPQGYAQRAQ